MRSPTFKSDDALLVSRLGLGWLTLSSLMSVIVALALIQGEGTEPTDPIYFLALLGPAAGWLSYFRGRLQDLFLLGLPPIVLGVIFFATHIPIAARPLA